LTVGGDSFKTADVVGAVKRRDVEQNRAGADATEFLKTTPIILEWQTTNLFSTCMLPRNMQLAFRDTFHDHSPLEDGNGKGGINAKRSFLNFPFICLDSTNLLNGTKAVLNEYRTVTNTNSRGTKENTK
jgi:hypothetical protein